MPPMIVAGAIVWSAVAINVAIMVAVSVGMALISNLLKPKMPSFASEVTERTLMKKTPIGSWWIQYGRAMTSGVITFEFESADKKFFYMVLTTHGHEITAFDEVWIENDKLTIDGATGNCIGPAKYFGKCKFQFNLGTRTQAAFPMLISECSGQWTANDTQSGRAGVAVKLETSDKTSFPNGIPNIKFLSRGKPVYDPRTATYGYSENVALCLADYLQSKAFGLGCRGGEAVRLQSTGGASVVKYSRDLVAPSLNGQVYETRVLMQNRGTGTVRVSDNLGGFQDVAAGVTADVRFIGTGDGSTFYKFRFETALAGDAMDVLVVDPVAHRMNFEENYIPRANRFFEGWTAISGATITTARDWSIFMEVDEADVIAAANVCDELVALQAGINGRGSGLSEARYAANGGFWSSKRVPDALADLKAAMAGDCVYFAGKWHLYAGAWRSPVLTLTDDDLADTLHVATLVTRRELCNVVKAQFVCPENKWQPGDVPALRNDTYVVQDGEEIVRQLELPFTITSPAAQRLMKIAMEEARRQETLTYPAKLRAYECCAPDIIGITRARYGWTAKTFKVQNAKFMQRNAGGNSDSAPTLGVDLYLRAYDAGIYTWAASEEQSLTALPAVIAPDPSAVAPVTGLAAASGAANAIIRADGVVITRVHLTWTAPADASVVASGSLLIEYKKSADPDWISAGTIGGATVETWIGDVVDGVNYDFRVTARNASGASSAAATVTGHTVVGVGYGAASYRPTSNPLSASDVGGFPRVTVAAFTMRIAGKGDVSISGGSVDATSADFGKTAFIFYDDLTFAGGGVVYQITFTRETALGTTGGRFFVGSISLPVSGGPATVGNNDGGTGAQYARSFALWPDTVTPDSGAWDDIDHVADTDGSSFAYSNATSVNSILTAKGFPAYSQLFSQVMLIVKHRLKSLTGISAQASVEVSQDGGANWAVARAITTADTNPVPTPFPLSVTQKTEKVQVRVTSPGGTGATPNSATPGTRVDDATVGTRAWSIATPDSVSSSGSGNFTSHFLKVTNFGFAIPNTATIVGIQAKVNCDASYEEDPTDPFTVWKYAKESTVEIVKGGTIMTAQNKSAGRTWPSAPSDLYYGGSSDLWGQTWAYTDINNAGFGLAISALLRRDVAAVGTTQARVYTVTLTVYTTSGPATSEIEIYEIKLEVTI